MPRKNYTGVLRKRIVIETGLRADDPLYVAQAMERLSAIFRWYKIAEDDDDHWRKLAIALAIDHVEGFRTTLALPRGVQRIVGPSGKKFEKATKFPGLVEAVDVLVKKRKLSIKSACESLARLHSGPFACPRKQTAAKHGGTLRTRYYEMKKAGPVQSAGR